MGRSTIFHWLRTPDEGFELAQSYSADVVATVRRAPGLLGWDWESRYAGTIFRQGTEPSPRRAARAAQRALKARHGAAGRIIICRNQDIVE